MVESRSIERTDIDTEYEGHSIDLRMAVVKLWDDSESDVCSRFNVQIKFRNSEVENFIDDNKLDGGKWTVIAHSDHNPHGGHDIRDGSDRKQLHVDVHPRITGDGYNHTYHQLCNGSPPTANEDAIRTVVSFVHSRKEEIVKRFLRCQE